MKKTTATLTILRCIVWGNAPVLSLTGVAKLVGTAFSEGKILLARDPMLPLAYWELFLLFGTLELVLAAGLLTSAKVVGWLTAVSVLSWCFVLYHSTALLLGIEDPCPCLGSAVAWIPILDGHARHAAFLLAVIMLSSSQVGLYILPRLETAELPA